MEHAEEAARDAGGRLSAELEVGDFVLVKRELSSGRPGATRFQERVYPGSYRVKEKIGPGTYRVEDVADRTAVLPFAQPINADRLIRLDMPELELQAGQPRRLLMRTRPTQPWNEYRIERFAADGRVQLRLEDGHARWYDLSECEYSWLE